MTHAPIHSRLPDHMLTFTSSCQSFITYIAPRGHPRVEPQRGSRSWSWATTMGEINRTMASMLPHRIHVLCIGHPPYAENDIVSLVSLPASIIASVVGGWRVGIRMGRVVERSCGRTHAGSNEGTARGVPRASANGSPTPSTNSGAGQCAAPCNNHRQ